MISPLLQDIERLNTSVKRLHDALEASRANEERARKERDEALVKIGKVAKVVEDYERGWTIPTIAVREISEAIGVCSLCGLLGRIADHPCTHLG